MESGFSGWEIAIVIERGSGGTQCADTEQIYCVRYAELYQLGDYRIIL